MVSNVLNHQFTKNFVYAPNYWQWFEHHKNHDILPDEIKHCETQLDLIRYLGLDVMSRNIYCNQQDYWFGGICDEFFERGIEKTISRHSDGRDTHTHINFKLSNGDLDEKLRYVFNESTVVQKEFLIKDSIKQFDLFEEFVASRKWKFNKAEFEKQQQRVGPDGMVMVGDFYSPLKMMHINLGPINSVYFLMEHPEPAERLITLHEENQLKAIEETVAGGAKVVMSMDNLDTMFHPPQYVEQYSASFYQKASEICHTHGAKFMIHACGNQKANLKLISSLGVDGLEGVAFPPLGNVTLVEAMNMTHDKFLITGGISAAEIEKLRTKDEIFSYVKQLFEEMRPYKNRFVLSASCNTPINTPWSTILHFRDAWLTYRAI
jgi:hypothetical protein